MTRPSTDLNVATTEWALRENGRVLTNGTVNLPSPSSTGEWIDLELTLADGLASATVAGTAVAKGINVNGRNGLVTLGSSYSAVVFDNFSMTAV